MKLQEQVLLRLDYYRFENETHTIVWQSCVNNCFALSFHYSDHHSLALQSVIGQLLLVLVLTCLEEVCIWGYLLLGGFQVGSYNHLENNVVMHN